MNAANLAAADVRQGIDAMVRTLQDPDRPRVVLVRDVADGRHRYAAGQLQDAGYRVWFSPLGAPSADKLATLLPVAGSPYDAAVMRVYNNDPSWARCDVALRWVRQRLGPCATPRTLVLFTTCGDMLIENLDVAGVQWAAVGSLADTASQTTAATQPEAPDAPAPVIYTPERLLRELQQHLPGDWTFQSQLADGPDTTWAMLRMHRHGVDWSAVIESSEPGVLLTAEVGDAEFDSSLIENATVARALIEVRNQACNAARLVCGLVGELAPEDRGRAPHLAPVMLPVGA